MTTATDKKEPLTPAIKLEKWGPGPWVDEPDHVEFRHNGVPCLMRRHPSSGHWCGYAAVEPGHPWHGKNYSGHWSENDDDYTPSPIDADVHGGLTYAAKCAGDICHVAQPGEPDDVWWLGFDFAHSGDFCPSSGGRERRVYFGESYKGAGYVRAECKRLAEQIIAARVAS